MTNVAGCSETEQWSFPGLSFFISEIIFSISITAIMSSRQLLTCAPKLSGVSTIGWTGDDVWAGRHTP